MKLREWLIKRVSRRKPDFIIGRSDQKPYLRRWWVIPRNPVFNIYLHQIIRSDADKEFHCHPWWNLSIILRGEYIERMPYRQDQPSTLDGHWYDDKLRTVGDMVLRGGKWRHRLIIPEMCECWTLFITGPRYRTWGFHCRKGFVPWTEFVDRDDSGKVGRGCGEKA